MKKLFLILALSVFALSGCATTGGLDMSETAGPPGAPPIGSNTDLEVKSLSIGSANPAAFDVDGDGTAEYILGDTVPSAANDTGTAGTIVISGGYLYFCSDTDTWIRTQLATW